MSCFVCTLFITHAIFMLVNHFLSFSPGASYQKCPWFTDRPTAARRHRWTVLSGRCPMAPGVDLWKAVKLDTAVSPPTATALAPPTPLSPSDPHPHRQHLRTPPTTAAHPQEEQYVSEVTACDASKVYRDAETITGEGQKGQRLWSGLLYLGCHGYNMSAMPNSDFIIAVAQIGCFRFSLDSLTLQGGWMER